MILHDTALRNLFVRDGVQPASLDLRLGETLLRLPYGVTLDPERDQSDLWQPVPLREDGRWMLGQGALYLGVTAEALAIPSNCAGLLHGVSSLGRLGLLVHVTAGLADPGWFGRLTLELVSLGGSILLRPGQRIAQLTVHQMTGEAEQTYSGRYQGNTQPMPSRAYLDVEARP